MVDMGLIEEGHKEILILHKKDPRNLNFLTWLVEYEKITDNLLNQTYYREQIAQLDPWNALNYFELGKIYLKQGDLSNSSKMKAKILSFAPDTEIAQQAMQELP
jgi:homoserine trans-succinylase